MRPRQAFRKSRRSALLAAIGVVGAFPSMFAAGCFTSSEGLEPPLSTFYFPTGLAVSPGNTTLYVANSDFDLQYSGGTVQALDLAALRGVAGAVADRIAATMTAGGPTLDQACGEAAGVPKNDQTLLYPGPCGPLIAASFVRASASIGAFASGVALLHDGDGPGARLFVPVRGDPSITYFDVADDRDPSAPSSPCADPLFCLDCGAASPADRCSSEHRVGENPYTNIRNVTLPPEPVGIGLTPRPAGDPVLIAHQTEQAVSLVVNRWDNGGRPTLEFFVSGLPVGPTEIASIPVPAAIDWVALTSQDPIDYRPGFLVTYRASNELSLLRYEDDARSSPARPFLSRAGGVVISENTAGNDSRGIAIDGSERAACEAECIPEDVACGIACMEAFPLRLFVANRAPPSLLVGRIETDAMESEGIITGAVDTIIIEDTVALTFGASRVELGYVVDPAGALSLRVFAVAFDSRFIFSYDPAARRVDAVIRTGRGPHDIAFDSNPADESGAGAHSFMHVGHFTDSYLGIVDLDMRRPTFGTMLVTVGPPVPPRDSN